MGRHAAVTYQQVATAADQLQGDGLRPAAKLVRTTLGGVGSLATIQKHLVDWRSRQGNGQPATRILPPEVQRSIFRFLDEEVARTNGELRQQVGQAERDIADIAAENEELTMLVSQLRQELAEHASLKDRQDGLLSGLLDELKTARAETARERDEAELARHELTNLKSRFEAQRPLEGELRQLRIDYEAEREVRVSAEREAAVLKAQKDSLEARIVELKEAASSQARTSGAIGNDHAGNQVQRAPQADVRFDKKVEGTGESGIPNYGLSPGAATAASGGQSDPRQAKLC